MADDIAVTLLLTRDGIDITSEIVGGRILNAPAGDYVATWTASDGVLPSISKTESLTVEDLPVAQVPTIIGSIADRTYTVGQLIPATDLRTKFAGATSYVVTPTTPWVFINGYNLVFDASSALEETSFSVRGVNADGQSDPVTFDLTISIAQQAPSVQTSPTITGSTTVGSILTRTAGTATGNPTPTRATVWLRNDEVIPGQTGNTLDTSGFAADDVITTRDDWTNSQGAASGTSAPWTLTVQPSITATIDLQPAGQQSSITFNVAIDGSPTIAQGSTSVTATRVGTTNQWTFTAPVEGPISFAATKAGYTAFSDATRTVAPALSALAERNYELVIDNDPGSEPLEIIDPQEYAGVYDISDATYTNGMRVLAPAVISRTGDLITATRDPLFSWLSDVEPVQFARAYYRGATPQTATLIAGTADAASYTVDPALDGGKNVYRRDWIEGSEGQLAVFSNGIAVAAPANWWTPDSIVDVDFQNNRARINGVSYASIAAARTANAIKTSPTGVDYTDVAGLGASYVLAAKGITPNVTSAQILAAMDDGDDGSTIDEIVYVGQQFANSQHRANLFAQAGGSPRLSSGNGPALTLNSPVRMAVRVKNSLYYGMADGVSGATSNSTGALPAVNRVTYGKRSVASELAWTGTVHRVVVINADLTNDQINALLA